MAWTTPKTWASEPLTSIDLNTYIRDNQNYLNGRIDGSGNQFIKNGGAYSTTSTTFVDVDATNMVHTITTTGGDVRVSVAGYGLVSGGGNYVFLGIDVDGTEYNVVVTESTNTGDACNVSFAYIVTGLAAGSHTFKLIWKVNGGTGTLADEVQFDVREDIGVVA